MRVAVLTVLVLLACVVSALGVQAAEGENGVLLQAGVYAPKDGGVRDELGSTWFNIGLDFKVARGRKVDHFAGIGWIRAKGETLIADLDRINPAFVPEVSRAETELRIIPVTYTQRSRPAGQTGFYAGGGAGVYFSKGEISATYPAETLNYDKSDAVLGVHFLGGAAIAGTVNVELRYTWMLGKTNLADIQGFNWERDISGLSLNIGARF